MSLFDIVDEFSAARKRFENINTFFLALWLKKYANVEQFLLGDNPLADDNVED